MSDAKKDALLILSKGKPDEEDGGDDKMPPLEEVMQEFIDAVKSGDAKGAAKAFRGAMAAGEEDEPEEEDAI